MSPQRAGVERQATIESGTLYERTEVKKRVPEEYQNIRIWDECLTEEFECEPRIYFQCNFIFKYFYFSRKDMKS